MPIYDRKKLQIFLQFFRIVDRHAGVLKKFIIIFSIRKNKFFRHWTGAGEKVQKWREKFRNNKKHPSICRYFLSEWNPNIDLTSTVSGLPAPKI